MSLAPLPDPPYYAVIFTGQRTDQDPDGYAEAAEAMGKLAAQQDGYIGFESVRGTDGLGITVSYWRDETAITRWKAQLDHLKVQNSGRKKWYQAYTVRVAKVERAYGFTAAD